MWGANTTAALLPSASYGVEATPQFFHLYLIHWGQQFSHGGQGTVCRTVTVLPLPCLPYMFQHAHLQMHCVNLPGVLVCRAVEPLLGYKSLTSYKFTGRYKGVFSAMMLSLMFIFKKVFSLGMNSRLIFFLSTFQRCYGLHNI